MVHRFVAKMLQLSRLLKQKVNPFQDQVGTYPYSQSWGVPPREGEGGSNSFLSPGPLPLTLATQAVDPRGPIHIFYWWGGPRDFFGSEVLAKRDFCASMEDVGIFWGIVLFISSNQQ